MQAGRTDLQLMAAGAHIRAQIKTGQLRGVRLIPAGPFQLAVVMKFVLRVSRNFHLFAAGISQPCSVTA